MNMEISFYRILFWLCFIPQCAPQSPAGKWGQKEFPMNVKGTLVCQEQPLPGAKLYLMDADQALDRVVASAYADDEGNFEFKGFVRDFFGAPDPYIRIEYHHFTGMIQIEDQIGTVRRENGPVKPFDYDIDFGAIDFNSQHCWAYRQYFVAIEDYKSRTNSELPYDVLHIRTGSRLPTLYSTLDTIRVPTSAGFFNNSVALNSFAQTIRNVLDAEGYPSHFVFDEFKYMYSQTHYCSKKTNPGFAFSEGWARYWAGECQEDFFTNKSKALFLYIYIYIQTL